MESQEQNELDFITMTLVKTSKELDSCYLDLSHEDTKRERTIDRDFNV